MAVKIIRNMGGVRAKVEKGKQSMVEAVTEAVISYGNVFVREDQGTLMESALIASRPKDGLAIWDTVYAKRVYEEGTPSKDKNPQASLRWVEKGVNTYKWFANVRRLPRMSPKTLFAKHPGPCRPLAANWIPWRRKPLKRG